MMNKKSSKRIWRKVISAELQSGGTSVFKQRLPLGSIWVMQLECGHEADRQPKYISAKDEKALGYRNGRKRAGWHSRRDPDDALPPPVKVICHSCENDARLAEHFNKIAYKQRHDPSIQGRLTHEEYIAED